MSILRDVAVELFGMFVADARLTLALLGVVAAAAAAVGYFPGTPLAGGAILAGGSLLVLLASVRRAARRPK